MAFRTFAPWLAATAAALAGCSSDPEWRTTASGLQWREIQAGTGPTLRPGDYATVAWIATKDDGSVFEDRRNDDPPTRIRVAPQVPKWWEEGLQLMRQGGRYEFRVPKALLWPPQVDLPALRDCRFVLYAVHVVEATRVPQFARPEPTHEVAGFPCQILAPGVGSPPAADHWCSVRFECWDDQGGVVDSSFASPQPLRRRIDTIPVPCLRTLLTHMAPGARWRATTPVETGEPRWAGILGAGTKLHWYIELLEAWPGPEVPAFSPPPADAMTLQPSGLRIAFDDPAMRAATPMPGRALAHFALWLSDGRLLECSHATGGPVEIDPQRLPAGAREALSLLAAGGAAWLRLPSTLAYGPAGRPEHGVPPDSDLVARIELVRRLP